MALHSLYCADVPLRNCSLTHFIMIRIYGQALDRLRQPKYYNSTLKLSLVSFLRSHSF